MSAGLFDLSISISAIDKASANLKQIERSSGVMSKNMKRHFRETAESLDKIGKSAIVAGGAMVGAMGIAGKTAMDFSKNMANVSTLIDTDVESMDDMKKSVLDLAKRTPVALEDLTGALYNIRSAGIDASLAMETLEKSAQLGVAGIGSTEEAVDLVTSSINAWGLKGEEARKVYDTIFKTVKFGKTNISSLAQGFGAVAGTVAAAGIKTDEYFASVAALTTVGQPAAQAYTQIKAAIAGLTRSTKEQQLIFHKLHAKDFGDLIQKSGGMVNAFSLISKSVHGNKAKLIELLGSVEAYNAVLGLTGGQNKAFSDTINSMRLGKNLFDEGYQKQLKEASSQVEILKNQMLAIGISFGTSVLPIINKGVGVLQRVTGLFDKLPQPIKTGIAAITLIGGIGLLSFGALAIGVSAAMKAVVDCKGTLGGLAGKMPGIARGILGLQRSFMMLGATIMTTPIGWLIAGGLVIAGVAIVIRRYWTPITEFFKGFAQGIKAALTPAINRFKEFIKPLAPAIKVAKDLGAAFVKWTQPIHTNGDKSRELGKQIGIIAVKAVKVIGTVLKFAALATPIGQVAWAAALIWKNWDKITDTIQKAFNKAKEFFSIFGGKKDININATVKGDSTSAPAAKSKGKYPKMAVGSEKITQSGFAVVHEGEEIVPKSQAGGSKNTYHITFAPKIIAPVGSSVSQLEAMVERCCDRLIKKLIQRKERLAF